MSAARMGHLVFIITPFRVFTRWRFLATPLPRAVRAAIPRRTLPRGGSRCFRDVPGACARSGGASWAFWSPLPTSSNFLSRCFRVLAMSTGHRAKAAPSLRVLLRERPTKRAVKRFRLTALFVEWRTQEDSATTVERLVRSPCVASPQALCHASCVPCLVAMSTGHRAKAAPSLRVLLSASQKQRRPSH